ncbi:hypothetical protein TanjilG_01133 [Lupinus angustifolius]|uniref:Uncharacterized protein n=1 Tax=Lupinus angustifolius TaxID=3871 RepID=A0A1J7GFE5_LUPAN|nr:hypothetical protein TanjilG_01133 [Lupinus angustifolius]
MWRHKNDSETKEYLERGRRLKPSNLVVTITTTCLTVALANSCPLCRSHQVSRFV